MQVTNTVGGKGFRMWDLVAAIVLFMSSCIATLLVAARAKAALWEWYKFLGYSTDGVITLSFKTGCMFTLSSTILLGTTYMLSHCKGGCAHTPTRRLLRAAAAMYLCAIGLYWIVALSPLNHWRL